MPIPWLNEHKSTAAMNYFLSVLWVLILPLSTFFLLHFGKCPDSVICFCFSFYFHLTYHVLQDSVSNIPYKQEYVTVNNNQCLIRIQIWCGHRI